MTGPVVWLLDTNVVSEMMRPNPDPRVTAFLDANPREEMAISVVTVWEIEKGVGRVDPGRRREDLARRFRDTAEEFFGDRVLAWTGEDGRACARIMEIKRRRGESLDAQLPDAMIASIARRRGLAVVTRDTAEFRNTGVDVVNPWLTEIQ